MSGQGADRMDVNGNSVAIKQAREGQCQAFLTLICQQAHAHGLSVEEAMTALDQAKTAIARLSKCGLQG